MGGLDAHIMTPLLVLGCAVSLLTEQLVTGAPHVLVVSCLFADSSSTSNECFSTDTVLVRHLLCFGCSAISVLSSISVYMQAQGLVGARGLLPLPVTLQAIEEFISSAGIDDPATCSAGIDDSATCSAGIDDEGSLWEKSLSRGLTKCMLRFVVWKYGCSSQQRTFHRQHLSSLLQLDIAASAISLVCPHPALYAYLYLSSWSHKRIGGPFYAFQWDALLLETMLVTALLAMARSAVQVSLVLWLMKVLLFRLMLGSALVKVFSRDLSRNVDFTAMRKRGLLTTLSSLFVEVASVLLVCPVLSCGSVYQAMHGWMAGSYIALQAFIAAMGHFGFFNYLVMVLSLSMLGDRQLTSMLGRTVTTRLGGFLKEHHSAGSSRDYYLPASLQGLTRIGAALLHPIVFYPLVLLVFASSVMALVDLLQRVGCVGSGGCRPEGCVSVALSQLQAAHRVLRRTFYLGSNYYGLFATPVMSRQERNEMLVEVGCPKHKHKPPPPSLLSLEAQHRKQAPTIEEERDWIPVEFIAKPGSSFLFAPPRAACPSFHLSRLDWLIRSLPPFKTNTEETNTEETEKEERERKEKRESYPSWFWVLLISILEWDNADIVQGLLHPTLNEALAARVSSTEDKGSLVVRVSMRQYRNNADEETREGGVHSHQCTNDMVSSLAAVVEPMVMVTMTLCDLYAALDAVDDAGDWRRAHRHRHHRKAPSPDTAQDIIARTILKFKADSSLANRQTEHHRSQRIVTPPHAAAPSDVDD